MTKDIMPPSTHCRLLIDPPAPGAWNMAVDETLLEWSAETGGCGWRFYGWQEPTLSLGYFQPYGDRQRHRPSQNCPAVRRLTGGGAIVHDAELTYSLVLPSRHPLAAQRDRLYEAVHGSLIEALVEVGVAAALFGHLAAAGATEQPFLCFERRAPGDVVMGPGKIAGSAQRRRRGAVLQHGSVLLRRSAAAPELAALEELAGQAPTAQELSELWLPKVFATLSLEMASEPLTDREQQQAAVLAEGRYAASGWTEHRGRRADGFYTLRG